MTTRGSLFLALTLVLLASAPTVTAQNTVAPRTITVSATDTVRISPDRVTVRFAVVTRAAQAEPARQQNAQASQRTLDAVRALGVPERQIQVQSLRLSEEIEYRQGRRVRIGFIARRDVEVVLDDMDRLPALVERVVQEGANEFGGIHYTLRDRRAAENAALRRVAQRAREKADVIASTLGTSIRGVHAVTETGVSFPQPRPEFSRAMVAMESDQAGTPGAYAEGEIEIRATLTVSFELE